jgi:hypothetical protein
MMIIVCECVFLLLLLLLFISNKTNQNNYELKKNPFVYMTFTHITN